jgi:phosphoglycolate phosphatase
MTQTLAELIGRARCLLIDFDGPICSVFAGYPAADIARELHTIVRNHFAGTPPPALADLPGDPLDTMTTVAAFGDNALTRAVADAGRDAEVTAVATATPTPGAADVLRAAWESDRRVVIVSNNASAAIESYLQSHNLSRYVDAVAARHDGMDPRQMKPDPHLVQHGLAAVQVPSADAVFIGDSITDIEAGTAAGTRTIGYANKPGKRDRLTDAGADIVIDAMQTLAQALQPTVVERPA